MRTNPRSIRRLALSGLCLSTLSALPACDALPDIAGFRDQAEAARAQIAAEADRLESAAQSLSPDDPAYDPSQAAVADARARQAEIAQIVDRLDGLIADADHRGAFSGVADALGPLLPEPLRLPAVLAAGLGVALFRARQLKKSAASIASGFQQAMNRDPEFKTAVQTHADLLRSIQTPTAGRIVDEVTKPEKPMLRLPV